MARSRLAIPQPGLWGTYNVAVASLSDKGRGHQYTYGLDAIIKRSSANITRVWRKGESIESVTEDTLLVSLTSPMDIYSLIDNINERPKQTRIVVGGQGAYPFHGYRDIVHSVFFGRAEQMEDNAFTGVVDGFQWDYRHNNNTVYSIRQPRELLHGETSVGCRGSCRFCQYSATRKFYGSGDYSATSSGHSVTEDRWSDIVPKTGNQTTALDGLSESTRSMVGKPVSDAEIIEKLNEILSTIEGTMRLKVFQIVGYPCETEKSVKCDLKRFSDILGRVKPGNGKSRIMMMITVTPFSPEPLTKMEDCAANIDVKWRDIFTSNEFKCAFDSPHLNAFFLPQIAGPLTLFKRVAANRCNDIDKLRKISKLKEIDKCISVLGDIHTSGAGYRVSNFLNVEKRRNDEY